MEKLQPFIVQGYCLRCQGCCRFAGEETIWEPQLLEEEKIRLAPHTRKIGLIVNSEQGNFACQFLNQKDSRCKIYSVHPFECQLYPFLINRQGKRVFLAVDLRCPYMKENTHLAQYKDYCAYLKSFFNSSDVKKTLKENPQLIQSYENVLDIFEIAL
ncbi:MAG: YkgJ family cysteine cluster protein [Candidatus Omnitrophota bacterium]|jgi:Fe-S-cluster containining protein